MVVVKLISGLGNQLFQYTAGRQISLNRGVPLKLDISFFETQHLRSYQLNHYNIQADIASEAEIARFKKPYQSHSLPAMIFRRAERFLPKRKKLYFKEQEWYVYEKDLLKASSRVYLDGYWQHHRYYEAISPQIFKELTVKEPYAEGLPAYLSGMEQDVSSVSLHIRRGDYITDKEANKLWGVLPLSYYYKAIGHITERISHPSFYIFSDDLGWAKDHLKIQAPVTFVDIGETAKDYIELELMSKCRHNIIANSSFSWWGAFLNRHPQKIVVAPARWCIPEDLNQKIELQFPSWIKL